MIISEVAIGASQWDWCVERNRSRGPSKMENICSYNPFKSLINNVLDAESDNKVNVVFVN